MRAPNHSPGEGVRWKCANPDCTQLLDRRSDTGRPRRFCSDRCRQQAHRNPGGLSRNPDFRNFRADLGGGSGLSRNPEKTSTKSKSKIAISADRGFAGKAVATVGNGVSPQVPVPTDASARSRLIRKAITLELDARWPRGGAR